MASAIFLSLKAHKDPKGKYIFVSTVEEEIEKNNFYITGSEFLRVYFIETHISPQFVSKLLTYIKKLPKFREFCYDIYFAQNLHKVL